MSEYHDPRSMVGDTGRLAPQVVDAGRAGVAKAREALRCTAQRNGARCVLQIGHHSRDGSTHEYETLDAA